MLILTRKRGESIHIGRNIKITIVDLKPNQVRIGIDAPQDQRVYREEIYLQILEENKMAASPVGEGAPVPQPSVPSGTAQKGLSGFKQLSAGSNIKKTPTPTSEGGSDE